MQRICHNTFREKTRRAGVHSKNTTVRQQGERLASEFPYSGRGGGYHQNSDGPHMEGIDRKRPEVEDDPSGP